MIVDQTVRALYVAWQQPESRRYFPVGRLVAGSANGRELYEFVYAGGALEAAAEGFRPFLAFPDFLGVYRSDRLFPFFTNRLMSRSRPDFPDYVARLGLDSSADDLTILARSGGMRATDSLEMFPLPLFDPALNCFQTYFWMHGFRHLTQEQQQRVLRLQPGERLVAEPEPTNPSDTNAIRLFSQDQIFVGCIPRYFASDACHLLKECNSFDVFVERVNPEPAPTQQRLLCDLQSCWPEGFVPCNTRTYRPLAPEAWRVDPCAPAIESPI